MARSRLIEQKTNSFLMRFAKEDAAVRNDIANILPAYNDLLNMHAMSFSEFALQIAAEEQGLNYKDPLFDYKTVRPLCPRCKENKVIRKTTNRYHCNNCGLNFSANWNSISSDANTSSLIWVKVLRCMLDYYSVSKTCSVCDISFTTYYNIRNRIFYAMDLALRDMKLYGIIQCDNTSVYINYRGMDLSDGEFPEESPLDIMDFKPRPARRRGSSNSNADKSINSVCIFAATDSFGHVLTRFVGIGPATATLLTQAVKSRFLLTVPEDAAPTANAQKQKSFPAPGTASLLVSDCEKAIAGFAKHYNIQHEQHVYRDNGIQLQLSEDAHDIQQANSLHSRLKAFLVKTNFVSTKYLPGFLTFFEWLENTQATDKAICELFRIISAPGKAPPTEFYRERFAVPNYLIQWSREDNPLRRFPDNKLLACYLYKQRKTAIEQGREKTAISLDEIAYRTGYAKDTVRRIYKNLHSAGLDVLVDKHFQARQAHSTAVSTETPEPTSDNVQEKLMPKLPILPPSVTREVLVMFDEFVADLLLPERQYLTFPIFTEAMNQKYGTAYTGRHLRHSFYLIEELGLRPKRPKRSSVPGRILPSWKKIVQTYNMYSALKQEYRIAGKPMPSKDEMVNQIAQQLGIPPTTVFNQLSDYPKIKRKMDIAGVTL